MVFNSIDFLVFFSNCSFNILFDTECKTVYMVIGIQLLFLYVLESQICVVASVFHIYYIYMWNFIGLFKC